MDLKTLTHDARDDERSMKHTVFVYGTLKKGYYNHHVLGADAEFVDYANTYGAELHSAGAFPAMMRGDRKVFGEVWAISDEALDRVDYLEGVEVGMYAREQIALQMHNSTDRNAWTYIADEMFFGGHLGPEIKPNANGMVVWE